MGEALQFAKDVIGRWTFVSTQVKVEAMQKNRKAKQREDKQVHNTVEHLSELKKLQVPELGCGALSSSSSSSF